ncbi:Uncharacterised protein [Bordetella pertussis]|nr:Uncharacterised protein [Bordetella pertussis]
MMACSRAFTCSRVQGRRAEFWLISRPDTATPPALLALPGAYSTSAAMKALAASRVAGMLAPSATHFTPLRISVRASFSSSSFWVAHGRATSTGTCQGRTPAS